MTGAVPNKDTNKNTTGGVAGASARDSSDGANTGASGASAEPNPPDSGNAIDAGVAMNNTDGGAQVMATRCPQGAALCDGSSVVVCNVRGERDVEKRCPFACVAGACAGACASGAQRCLGKIRQVCDAAGNWRNAETCSTVCTPAACRVGCTEGSRQCNGAVAMVCRNGAYVEEQTCKFVCQAGACTGDCAPGTYQCTNNAIAACGADGHWLAPTKCLNACSMGACTGVCTPGQQRCGGSSGYQICSDAGQWGATTSCDGKACVDGLCAGVCEPGTTRCEDSQTIASCGPNGTWGSPMACPSQACVAGRCVGSCQPGTVRCKAGAVAQVEQCSPAGAWEDGVICANQACLDGSCQGLCRPGEKRCDATSARAVQHCDASGNWTTGLSCESNQVCSNSGECISQPGCQPGSAPNWIATASGRGDPAWTDPRWGTDTGTPFARVFAQDAGGYVALFDRAANDLVVTFRIWANPGEAPTSSDYVYLGITSNLPSASFSAHDTKIPLISLAPGESARPINAYESAVFSNGSWSLQGTPDGWMSDVAAWRGNDGGTLAWAVSIRIDLDRAGIDPAREFRMAVKAHVDARGDLFSPASGSQLSDTPTDWSAVNLPSSPCVVRVTL